MSDINLAKAEFIDIFTKHVTRAGADKLLEYLTGSDFFTAPASGRFHLAERGGLCQHSLNVYKRLLKIVEEEYGTNYQETVSDETIAICGLLHDVCKVNYYVSDYRNVKEDNVWVKKPYFRVEEKFPYGHGEKSVFIVSQYIKLTAEEAMAINWHMGGFDDRVKGGSFSLSDAYAKYKLALFMHVADLTATYIDEDRGFNP
ncbi:MAG: HD domain-containing protein [Clostridiales bacterium]|nr:HD domain-containing protein [Clostridiales bacterium]